MRFFKTLHFLSLDVVLGACLFQCLLTTIFLSGQFPPLLVTLALAFAVWTIYLVDRFIDNQNPVFHSALHDFHLKHVHQIKYLIGGNILVLILLVACLPKYLIINGLLIGIFMLVYWAFLIFGFFKRVKFSKEISTAIIYTTGIFLYVFSNAPNSNMVLLALMVFLFFLLALQNLVVFTCLSNSELKGESMLIGIEVMWISLWLAILFFTHLSIFLLLPFLLTFVIHLWIHYISKSKQWAWVGEIAFFSPLFYYLYAVIST
jgi:hypothetical protein